jgi:DNA polymerase-3 subunit gamma/tau
MYLPIARKYRPQTFEQVVSQAHITQTLQNAIAADRVAHAMLFSGPRGTGKTTIARILAKAMNCKEGPTPVPCNACRSCEEITAGNAADVFEIDGASNNSVDQIRELRENIKYMPQHDTYKIYIIDEVHMLSLAAFNALLKTLEEPPAHVLFFFATTEPHKIPITILSRCQRHDLRRIELASIADHMKSICEKEAVSITDETLGLIAREAGGCMRDGLSLLDQIISSASGPIDLDQVLNLLDVVDRKVLFEISGAILQNNTSGFLDILHQIYSHGHDLKKFYADFLEHIRNLLVLKMGEGMSGLVNVPAHEIEEMQAMIEPVSETYLSQLLEQLFKEEAAIKYSSQPRLALEMAGIKMLQLKPALPIDTLIQKLDTLRNEFSGTGQTSDQIAGQVPDDGPGSRAFENDETPGASKKKTTDPKGKIERGRGGEDTPAPSISKIDLTAGNQEKLWENLQKKICDQIPSLTAPLSNSTIKEMTDQKIVIKVHDNNFNINLLNRKKDAIVDVLSNLFEKRMHLSIETQINRDNDLNKKIDQSNRLKKEALQHPLVSEAVTIFNGKVVDVKIL